MDEPEPDGHLVRASTYDGAAKLFVWHALLDATTGPANRMSVFKMKAAADETRLDSCIDMMSKIMKDLDSGLFFSGRNALDLQVALETLNPEP